MAEAGSFALFFLVKSCTTLLQGSAYSTVCHEPVNTMLVGSSRMQGGESTPTNVGDESRDDDVVGIRLPISREIINVRSQFSITVPNLGNSRSAAAWTRNSGRLQKPPERALPLNQSSRPEYEGTPEIVTITPFLFLSFYVAKLPKSLPATCLSTVNY